MPSCLASTRALCLADLHWWVSMSDSRAECGYSPTNHGTHLGETVSRIPVWCSYLFFGKWKPIWRKGFAAALSSVMVIYCPEISLIINCVHILYCTSTHCLGLFQMAEQTRACIIIDPGCCPGTWLQKYSFVILQLSCLYNPIFQALDLPAFKSSFFFMPFSCWISHLNLGCTSHCFSFAVIVFLPLFASIVY